MGAQLADRGRVRSREWHPVPLQAPQTFVAVLLDEVAFGLPGAAGTCLCTRATN